MTPTTCTMLDFIYKGGHSGANIGAIQFPSASTEENWIPRPLKMGGRTVRGEREEVVYSAFTQNTYAKSTAFFFS